MTIELIQVSIGELWDKYSILLIKQEKIKDKDKLKNIVSEIQFLDQNMKKYNYKDNQLFLQLKNINLQLWDIEDKIRIKELNKDFSNEFIQLARNVYIVNDKRAECKKKINILFRSKIHEVKDYVKYN